MNILTAQQIRDWDAYTIANEPIASIDLMERAAGKVTAWLTDRVGKVPYHIFCGPGNNGGDGLAIARQLFENGFTVFVYLLDIGKLSDDAATNLARLREKSMHVQPIKGVEDLPAVPGDAVIVEALFGSGLNRQLEGLPATVVEHINRQSAPIVSIDMPAGLFADKPAAGPGIIKANYTLTFQVPKLALFFPENEVYCGFWEVLDIGLHPGFEAQSPIEWILPDSPWLNLKIYRKHAHKGILGHALIAAGSKEKMGAAVMSARACLTSGSGLLTMAVPESCFSIIQSTTPEAMCQALDEASNELYLERAKIKAVGIGPGWKEFEEYFALLEEMILKVKLPLLIDATGLFHLASNPSLLTLRPKGAETVLTPHAGEFARLFGTSANSFERMEKALAKAKEYNVFIVLKGAYTQVITPGGMSYFNSTGNPGMGKGGSGDVLTGIITSLLAQRYPAVLACIIGVYAHGLAGDLAAAELSQYGMTAMDIVKYLPQAWKKMSGITA